MTFRGNNQFNLINQIKNKMLNMKNVSTRGFLLPLTLIAFSGVLQAQTVTTGQPPQAVQPFETPGYVDAATFVPANRMTGGLYSVGDKAWNNGLQNTYILTNGGQTQAITGTLLLLQRINEIYALDYLNGLSKTQEFTDALAKSLRAKEDSVVDIVNNPIGTLRGLPGGASRFFGGFEEALKGGG